MCATRTGRPVGGTIGGPFGGESGDRNSPVLVPVIHEWVATQSSSPMICVSSKCRSGNAVRIARTTSLKKVAGEAGLGRMLVINCGRRDDLINNGRVTLVEGFGKDASDELLVRRNAHRALLAYSSYVSSDEYLLSYAV